MNYNIYTSEGRKAVALRFDQTVMPLLEALGFQNVTEGDVLRKFPEIGWRYRRSLEHASVRINFDYSLYAPDYEHVILEFAAGGFAAHTYELDWARGDRAAKSYTIINESDIESGARRLVEDLETRYREFWDQPAEVCARLLAETGDRGRRVHEQQWAEAVRTGGPTESEAVVPKRKKPRFSGLEVAGAAVMVYRLWRKRRRK